MASNSKKRRRVLGASCILAALIIASSSFAWFTSKDEVTNRLTATADYGVSIAEDFTPPANWIPGQKIDKNVAVVNTGNVDAFVRTWLEGEMNLLAQVRDRATWDNTNDKFVDSGSDAKEPLLNTLTYNGTATTTITGLKDTTDEKLVALGMTYSYEDTTDDEKVYLKELDTKIFHNPNTPTAAATNPVAGTSDGFNEVMSVQAGGVLAYLETGAADEAKLFIYRPDNANTFKSNKGNEYNVDGEKLYTVYLDNNGSTLTGSEDIKVTDSNIYVDSEATAIKYLGEHVDSDNFYPAATGLFVFRRNADKQAGTNDPTISDYEFSGYYYVKTSTGSESGDTEAVKTAATTNGTTIAQEAFKKQGKYFALQNDVVSTDQRSNYVLEKDKYSIVRNDDGTIVFYPYSDAYTDGATTIYKVGSDYYNANGEKVTTSGTPTADTKKEVTLFTAQQKVYDDNDLVWKYFDSTNTYVEYTKASSPTYYVYGSKVYDSIADIKKGNESTAISYADLTNTASSGYAAGTDTPITTMPLLVAIKDNIIINVALADTVGTGAENWTVKAPTGTENYTFYYNNDVEEGATTSQLVDSLELDSSITQDDYIAFDFDLNVFMESAQVTMTDEGKEAFATVTPWAATSGKNVASTGSHSGTQSGTEITLISWS